MRSILWFFISIVLLSGCSSINTSAINRTDLTEPLRDEGVVIGKVKYVVDGIPLEYHLLNRPALYLARNDLHAYFATPETDKAGSFIWSMPAGEYEVSVIFGGLPGKTSYWWRKDGRGHMVNGITDPHIWLSVEAGIIQYIGTIVIDASSRESTALIKIIDEPLFDTLNEIKIVDDFAEDKAVNKYLESSLIAKRLAELRPRRE